MNKVNGTLNRSRGALGNWCVSFGDNTEHGEVGGRDLSTFSFFFLLVFFSFLLYIICSDYCQQQHFSVHP